jgi:HK97 family phage portal protein
MGLLERLFNRFKRIDQRYDYGSSLTSLVREFGAMPVYPDPKVDRYLEAYTENAAVYSIVNLAARKFAFVPRYVMKEEDEEQEKSYKRLLKQGQFLRAQRVKTKAYSAPDGKGAKNLEQLLARPNPSYGQDLFYYSIYVSYKICGEAFVWLNRGDTEGMDDDTIGKMPVLEMYWLPADLVTIIPDPLDVWGCMGYELDIGGKRAFLTKSNVIHWKTFNPFFDETTRTHLRGLLPPINKILQQEEDSTDAAVAMYQHGGARGILYEKTLGMKMTVEQKSKIEDITAKRVNNKDLKSAIANLQGDWGYLDIGKDSVDMQLLEGNDKAFAKLCHAFNVPPGLFLIDQTYENQRSNRKRMLSELIMPDCASFNDEMNRQLLPAFGLKGQKIEPDYSELPEMQEDMKDMITMLKDAPITKNEFRDSIGYDPLPGEMMDVVFVSSNDVPIDEISIMDQVLANGQAGGAAGNGKVSSNGQGKKLPAGKG